MNILPLFICHLIRNRIFPVYNLILQRINSKMIHTGSFQFHKF